MINFKIHSNEIDKLGKFTKEEKNFRLQNLNYFNDIGLPSKRSEDWKFSDLKEIVSKNRYEKVSAVSIRGVVKVVRKKVVRKKVSVLGGPRSAAKKVVRKNGTKDFM